MNDWELDEVEHREIFERDIRPLYFPDPPPATTPTLVLLAGQPGSGRSRPTAALMGEHADGLAVVVAEDLQAFHPRYRESASTAADDGSASVGRAVAGWVRDGIRHARENGRSLLLEGTFQDPSATAAFTKRFADAGFRTRVVVVGSRRDESLLTVMSRYLRDVHAGARAHYTSREAHDQGFEGTRALVAALEGSPFADRLTIVDRRGRSVYDVRRDEESAGFGGAGAALVAAQSARMSRFDATQWLSELHHVTDFATSELRDSAGVVEILVDLHEMSIREVIPQLHVPAAGKFAASMEQRTASTLAALRRMLPTPVRVDAPAPVLTPIGPDRGGISR